MESIGYIRYHYLDASAAVKLLVAEPRADVVLRFFESNSMFLINSMCATEVLSALKSKYLHRAELTYDQYIEAAYYFSALLRDKLKFEETPIHERSFWDGAEQLARRHQLDLIDAIQLHSIGHGQHSRLVDQSRSLFITADNRLAVAARSEGLDTWDVMNEDAPKRQAA